MKITVIITVTIMVVFAGAQFLIAQSSKNIETYNYEVEKIFPDFEIRQYDAALFSSYSMQYDSYKNSSGNGFRVLAGYIFGGNEKEQSIAMTSPVVMNMDDSIKMMFMVPNNYKKEDLPAPNDPRIQFEEHAAKRMAAITFGGFTSDEKIEKYQKQLVACLEREGIKHTGQFSYFGYNPPYELVNRRNEVVVEIIQ